MAAAFCIYRDDTEEAPPGDDQWEQPEMSGIACNGIWAQSGTSSDTFATYWFPNDQVATILPLLNDSTLDLFSSDYDSYIVADDYRGMTHYDIGTSGGSLYQADKFMLNAASAPNYTNNKDIRYYGGDEVDLFHLN